MSFDWQINFGDILTIGSWVVMALYVCIRYFRKFKVAILQHQLDRERWVQDMKHIKEELGRLRGRLD